MENMTAGGGSRETDEGVKLMTEHAGSALKKLQLCKSHTTNNQVCKNINIYPCSKSPDAAEVAASIDPH